MTFVSNQRPAAPWKNSNWWGIWDTAANLPNAAASPDQMSDLQKGDMAWANAPAGLYVCSDATPGAAVWTLVTSAGGGVVGPENVVFLEIGGSDATGQRGNAALPFATWAAAWGVMQNGDQLRIGPGAFLGLGGTVPPANFSIVAAGRGVTRVVCAAGDLISAPNTLSSFLIQDITIDCSGGGGRVIDVNGVGGAGATLSNGGFFVNCELRSTPQPVIELSHCGPVTLFNSRVRDGGIIANTATVHTHDVDLDGGDITLGWVADADTPSRSSGTHSNLQMNTANAIRLTGCPAVRFAPDCRLGDVTSMAGALTVAGGNVPSLEVWCRMTGFAVVLPDTANPCTTDLRGAICSGVVNVTVTGAPPVNRQRVEARGLMLLSDAPAQLVAGDKVDIFVFSDVVGSLIYSTLGDGTITPSRWVSNGAVVLTGATVVPYGFTAFSIPVFAVGSPAVPATGAIGVAPAANQLVATPAVNGSAYFEVRWA